MFSPVRPRPIPVLLCLAAAVLAAIAALRGPEYDEGYTLLLLAGHRLPTWPASFTAGQARAMLHGPWNFAQIARDLRHGDVHPPLYFWAVAMWRSLFGPSLLALRIFSVACGVASLALVAAIARGSRVPPGTAILMTLGSYAFAYTSGVARGFALAQVLVLAGALVLIRARRARVGFAGGLLLGAATFSNYLAVFVGVAAVVWRLVPTPHPGPLPGGEGEASTAPSPLGLGRGADQGRGEGWRGGAGTVLGLVIWVPADLYFFLAQRGSRAGQFPGFDLLADIARLARLMVAAILGGLPLYAGGARPVVAAAMAALALILLVVIVGRWKRLGPHRWLFALCAAAMPVGLLALGAVFGNAPLELRYLAFSMPFAALLIAGATAGLPWLRAAVLGVQAAAILGLATLPQTMQPQARAAREAAALGGLALLPSGNDGVGVVVPFVLAAPGGQRMVLVSRGQTPESIRASVGRAPRVVLVLLARDADSKATLPAMRAAFTDPCWRALGARLYAAAFDRICEAP